MQSIGEIIIDKWYSGAGQKGDLIVKVTKANNKLLLLFEYIMRGEYKKLSSEGSITYKIENLQLCSQRYLDEHLPVGHEDQFQEIKNEHSINNTNKQENGESKNNSSEVLSTNSNGSKPKGRGKVAISSRRQSVSTGCRPKGNETIANYCRTQISSVKITRTIVVSGHN